MAHFNQSSPIERAGVQEIDQGLRSFLLKVYNYMFLGLGLTTVVAYFSARTPAISNLFLSVSQDGSQIVPSGLNWIMLFGQLGAVFYLSARVDRIAPQTAQIIFWAYAASVGLTISYLFLMYTGESLMRAFLVTSLMFGSMSLYGYVTKKDLTKFGSILFMGLLGIILASVINIFIGSSMLQFGVSVLGVLIFTGLTAYDTQRLKFIYNSGYSEGDTTKLAVLGALSLYLNFLNLFLMLLRFLGDRR